MSATNPERSPQSRRARNIVIWVIVALVVIVAAGVVWVGVRGLQAKDELEKAVPLAATIQREVMAGDSEAAARTTDRLVVRAGHAVELTGDPVWRAFEFVPALGSNLTALREVAAVVDGITRNAIYPITSVAGSIELSDFKPVNGTLDVQPLVAARLRVGGAYTAMLAADQRVRDINTEQTFPPVRDAVEQLKATVTTATQGIDAVNRAVKLLPAMLGASGPRNYLLLFQNPAELRSTGGIAGAVALVHTEGGRMSLAQQASSGDFQVAPAPVLTLPPETKDLYGDITGQYIQDVNLTPHFPLSALLAREMWKQRFGLIADGVLSIDPVALSYLLEATGPIQLHTGEVLSADNAVQLLLKDVYARYERPADQDIFFTDAAASVFSTVASGNVQPRALIEALAKAGAEHRVLVWSAHDDDQAVLADTTLAGALPRSDEDTIRFGVYFNDATGAKMDTYLDTRIAVGQATCRNDKRPNFSVAVTLTNTAPADAATSLPDYVTGGGRYGVAAGHIKTLLAVYGTPSMEGLGTSRDGVAVGSHQATDTLYPVSTMSVSLAPGESTVLRFDWLDAQPFSGVVETRSTPVLNSRGTEKIDLDCNALASK